MIKKGLRFQTKLIMAMFLVILVVTTAILAITERKVRKAYFRHSESEFSALASGIEESRETRSREGMEISKKLAELPYVVEFLKKGTPPGKEETLDFWKTYLAELSPGRISGLATQTSRFNKPYGGASPLNRMDQNGVPSVFSQELLSKIGIIGAIDREGKRYTLSPGNRKMKKRPLLNQSSGGGKIENLNDVLNIDTQQIGYFEIETRDGRTQVQEMVITPVVDPDTSEKLGQFLRGTSAETSAERFLDRYNAHFESDSKMESGVFLNGKFHSRLTSDTRSLAIQKAVEPIFSSLTKNSTQQKEDHPQTDRMIVSVGGTPSLMFFTSLNASPHLPEAWQIVLFPLTDLTRDVRELRLIGGSAGLLALLLGLGIALLLARNLAVPIRELSEGTRHIQEGDFQMRVKVHSGDEIGELANSFNNMAGELEQKETYRDLLEKVSDEAVAQAMINGSLDLELGGELKRISVLFCDIRGFTSITENMHPSQVIKMLNDHMTTMTRVVRENSGVVDKFIGDEIMAVFGALRNEGNDAANAAHCAVRMIEERERQNLSLDRPIHIGIGIATGEVVAGCMGSVDRLNYTVLGARVNLAARLCSEAREMECVIDKETLSQLENPVGVESLSNLKLKGFTGAVSAFRLNSMKNV